MPRFLVLLLCLFPWSIAGQPATRLTLGTNLGGITDYSSELPFVDLMHSARVWYTKDAEDPEWDGPWDTGVAGRLTYRPDGYPTRVPQAVAGMKYGQRVATVWGDTSAWPEGTWVVLWDGAGKVSVAGRVKDPTPTSAHRLTFRYQRPPAGEGASVELVIETSSAADPVRNIRVLMPGTEATSRDQPFNPLWLSRLKVFSSVRFMDWGATNGWGQNDPWTWDDPALVSWSRRAQMDHYTWADGRGVPYEVMVRLMNDQGLDGWVCVPHRADADYLAAMARLFHTTLAPKRKLTVEYSNEVWNWMFGQTQWLKAYGHPSPTALANHRDRPQAFPDDPATTWPEKVTGNIQDALDAWTKEYGADRSRLTRVVGLQAGWLDVSQRLANNLRPGSFDAVAPAAYFALGDEADRALDALGPRAQVSDVAAQVRRGWEVNEKPWLRGIQAQVARKLGVPMVFYEGGQHLTPVPFGQDPSYAPALLAIQRDPVMLDLYREWFQFLKTLGRPGEPLVLMNFSFVGRPSAAYGSWGILETLDQDTAQVPAPKHQAVLEALR